VCQPVYEIAATAMALLIDKLIPQGPGAESVILPTTLVVRRSTAPVARRES